MVVVADNGYVQKDLPEEEEEEDGKMMLEESKQISVAA